MKDKVVIITGGSSGIGKALADEFGSKGAKIVITGRNTEALDHSIADLKEKNIEAFGIKSDVSKEEDNKEMVKQVLEKYGKIDILINNAGISMRALFEELNLDVIRQVMDINFFGTVNATKYCLPEIIKTKGSIIGISSIAGFRGLPGRVGYSASKFAMQGFLEALRTELLYKGVHVLTACPGFTASNIRKKSLTNDGSHQGESPRNEQKMMSAEECAKHIYKATKKRKKFLILTPIGKITVFLNKLFPGFMDKMTYNALAKEPDSPFSNSKN
ncbi:SDR family oxidoreductase [Flexithrix dorotheae]|uniref:SDR family oxidoreductase n=1 Tax=Flexithrix dorotheae TaxID=70993 RepID=UPI00036BCC95|nr:SDR family oxidoreductase [Flexithrix dorotheae]